MAKLTEDQLLDLIEKNGGPKGLDLRGQDLSGLDLSRGHILEKLKERGYTSLEPQGFLERWEKLGSWEGMREKDFVNGDLPPWLSENPLGLNLQDAYLDEANLKDAHLYEANLKDADLYEANLQDAHLMLAKLQGAHLTAAKLQRANLTWAKLQGADLKEAKLQRANLALADLQRADLRFANLRDAFLTGAKLQGASLAWADGLEEAHLEDVDWSQGYLLGEEARKGYSATEAVYRQLKQWYSRSGQYDHAAEFHYREMECLRKGVQGEVGGWWKVWKAWGQIRKEWPKLGSWFWLWFLKLSCGYGERPLRTLGWLGLFLLVPAIFYGLLSPLSGWQALYYSFASLVAFINPLDVEISPWLGTVALVKPTPAISC